MKNYCELEIDEIFAQSAQKTFERKREKIVEK